MRINGNIFILLCAVLLPLGYGHAQQANTSHNPDDIELIASDINLFYQAFDRAIADTVNASQIFKKEYLKKGSKGLKDFYKLKIKDVDQLSQFVIKHQDFYAAIRSDITHLDSLENEIHLNFNAFRQLYPQAVFPDVYFVVGRFNSNGTISKRGLLIGTELLCRTENTNTNNWHPSIIKHSMLKSHIPVTVSHELIHFNQFKMAEDHSMLWKCIREGSAEFIAELICGQTDGDYSRFDGKEMEVLNQFELIKDKSFWSHWNDWQQAENSRPNNAGYWMGYMICKAYYNQTKDSKQTINDILNIQDYKTFYRLSKVDSYLKTK